MMPSVHERPVLQCRRGAREREPADDLGGGGGGGGCCFAAARGAEADDDDEERRADEAGEVGLEVVEGRGREEAVGRLRVGFWIVSDDVAEENRVVGCVFEGAEDEALGAEQVGEARGCAGGLVACRCRVGLSPVRGWGRDG